MHEMIAVRDPLVARHRKHLGRETGRLDLVASVAEELRARRLAASKNLVVFETKRKADG